MWRSGYWILGTSSASVHHAILPLPYLLKWAEALDNPDQGSSNLFCKRLKNKGVQLYRAVSTEASQSCSCSVKNTAANTWCTGIVLAPNNISFLQIDNGRTWPWAFPNLGKARGSTSFSSIFPISSCLEGPWVLTCMVASYRGTLRSPSKVREFGKQGLVDTISETRAYVHTQKLWGKHSHAFILSDCRDEFGRKHSGSSTQLRRKSV